MGYHKLPSWRSYWDNSQDMSVPFVSSVMPHTHYTDILSNLHVNNNDNIPVANTDKMFKLRLLIESLNQNLSFFK